MPIQEYSGDYFLKLLKDLSRSTGVSLPQAELDTLQRLVDEERQREEALKSWMRIQDNKIGMNFLDLPIFPIYSRVVDVSSASISIPIPGDYKHLLMFVSAKTDRAAIDDWIHARFNDDTGSNYMEAYSGEVGASASNGEQTSRTDFGLSITTGATAASGSTGSSVIFIPHYTSNVWKTALKIYGSGWLVPASMLILSTFSVWKNTDPIKKITIYSYNSANISNGSIFSIYGIK